MRITIILLSIIFCSADAMEPTPTAHQANALLLKAVADKKIKMGMDLNEPIENGMPLLVISAQNDEYIKTTARLLRHGANPDAVSAAGTTPLLQSTFYCAPKTVALLLFWKADPNHTQYQLNATKETPLHFACRPKLDSTDQRINNARIEIVEWLCAAGADTNARDWRGRTPLNSLTLAYHENASSVLFSPRKKMIFHKMRKSLIETLMLCKANPTLLNMQGFSAITQPECEPYLAIFTSIKLTERRKKLRSVLLKFLSGSHMKPDAISPFKEIPCDILRYILKHAYP